VGALRSFQLFPPFPNLPNDRYLNRLFDSGAQPQAISGYRNLPRTYGVSARFKC